MSNQKDHIIQVAYNQFKQFGFKNVTMDDLSRASGISKKTLYELFKDKDDLVEEVVKFMVNWNETATCEIMGATQNAVEEIFKILSQVELMIRGLNPVAYMDLQKYYPNAFKLLQAHKECHVFNCIKDNLIRGIAQGYYRDDVDVEIISRFRMESSMFMMQRNIFPAENFDMLKVNQQLFAMYLYGVATSKGHKLISKFFNSMLPIKSVILILAFSLFGLWASAQSNHSMSLKQCTEYALTNQPKMKGLLLDEQLQLEKNKEIVGIARPQVQATGQFQYLFIVPKSRLDANAFNFGSSFSFFKVDTPAYIAYQQQPKEKYSEAKFGLPLNMSAGIQASQILFDAGVLVALEARKSLEELSKINTQRTAEEIKVSVAKAYYNCIIAEKRMSLLDENIKLLATVEDMTQKLHKEGFAERIDADRLTVQKNNLITEKSKIQNLIDLSYALLKFQMGMNLKDQINLTDDITLEEVKNGLDIDKVINYDNRVEMSLMKTIKKLNEYDVKRYKKGYLPTVAAAVSGSYASQTIAFKELFTLPYFPTGAFVLSASLPIYDGGSRKAKMRQAQLNVLKNENDIQAIKNGIDLEYDNAKTQLRNTFISLDNQKSNITLAQKVYDIAQKKYKEGVGTNIEILQAETALKDAQINYYNTLFEAMMAKIDFQKSLGLMK